MENNMLDFRIHTFLAVCEQMSITKAASVLNLTQPAVTQHMQALQQQLGTCPPKGTSNSIWSHTHHR
jgi:hypothetical protein